MWIVCDYWRRNADFFLGCNHSIECVKYSFVRLTDRRTFIVLNSFFAAELPSLCFVICWRSSANVIFTAHTSLAQCRRNMHLMREREPVRTHTWDRVRVIDTLSLVNTAPYRLSLFIICLLEYSRIERMTDVCLDHKLRTSIINVTFRLCSKPKADQ